MTKSSARHGVVLGLRPPSFQLVLNAVLFSGIVLFAYGLWVTVCEIDKLKHTTGEVALTVTKLAKDGDWSQKDLLDALGSIGSLLKPNSEAHAQLSRLRRDVSRREASSGNSNYDPLALNFKSPQMEEQCWAIIRSRCAENLAPGFQVQFTGPPGPPGLQGVKGEPGRPGRMGHMGPPGHTGNKGQKGEKGLTGTVGEPGADGPRGPRGLEGLNGPPGKRGKKGRPGQKGSPGPKGDPGLRGIPGEKGDGGVAGVVQDGVNCTCQGEKGQKGSRGLIGFSGFKGDKGEPGYGVPGIPGPRGPPGSKGEKGDKGVCTVPHCGQPYVDVPQGTQSDGKHSSYKEKYSNSKETALPRSAPRVQRSKHPEVVSSTGPMRDRVAACNLTAIGIPVYVKKETTTSGSWLADPFQPEKRWLTRGYYGEYLEEYSSINHLKRAAPDRLYSLGHYRFFGTRHAMYNGSFYYQMVGFPDIVRYDTSVAAVTGNIPLPGSAHNQSEYLYTSSHTYYDIAVDEHGLWVIYSMVNDESIFVTKIDTTAMTRVKTWRLPVDRGSYANGFLVCGTYYLIKPTRATRTQITLKFDLYNSRTGTSNLTFRRPFRRINMVTYFPHPAQHKRALLAWDNDILITYPVLLT